VNGKLNCTTIDLQVLATGFSNFKIPLSLTLHI
jgi:hypothetical protein